MLHRETSYVKVQTTVRDRPQLGSLAEMYVRGWASNVWTASAVKLRYWNRQIASCHGPMHAGRIVADGHGAAAVDAERAIERVDGNLLVGVPSGLWAGCGSIARVVCACLLGMFAAQGVPGA